MNEYSEGACLHNKTSVAHISWFLTSSEVVPTCQHAPMTAEQSACECHYGNDMKLERKRGLAQTNKKKDKQREAKCTKMQRDIHQHKQ